LSLRARNEAEALHGTAAAWHSRHLLLKKLALSSDAGTECGSWHEPHHNRSPLAILHRLSASFSKWLVTFISAGAPDQTNTDT
jgi:hypothetical protein